MLKSVMFVCVFVVIERHIPLITARRGQEGCHDVTITLRLECRATGDQDSLAGPKRYTLVI